MQTPSKENEQAAFEGLLGAVDTISTFFAYSKELGERQDRLLVLLTILALLH